MTTEQQQYVSLWIAALLLKKRATELWKGFSEKEAKEVLKECDRIEAEQNNNQ